MYEAKDYSKLIGMKGFSEPLLKNHFTLYNGYVANCNKLLEALMKMLEEDKAGAVEFAELKRRLGWEWNGMRLHELYFENLGGDGIFPQEGHLSKLINEQFGSYENWKKEFIGIGLMRGIGWVILYQDVHTGKLINFWINEHDVGHPAGCSPLLVMDVFEHAYMIDYGLKKKDYIEAFFENINWNEVEKRIIR
uniref:superoxide dismutase n=1 Tax=Thermodesulfobacterium geofontis TaxID=1295609 RepID=A0A7V5XHE2_9BACT